MTLGKLAFARPGRLVFVGLASLIVGMLGWSVAWLVQRVVDQPQAAIGFLALGVVIAALVRSGVGIARRWVQIGLVHRIESELGIKFLDHAFKSDLRAIESFSDGELYRRLRGLDIVRFAVEERVLGSVFDGILVAVAATILAFYSVNLAALALVGAAIPAAVVLGLKWTIRRSSESHQTENSRLTQSVLDSLRGLRDARLFSAEEWILNRVRRDLNAFHAGRMRHLLLMSSIQGVTGFLGTAAGILVLYWGAGDLSGGRLMFVFTLTGLMLQPLEQLAVSFFAFDEASVALRRWGEIVSLPVVSRGAVPSGLADLALESVSFNYRPGCKILDGISLQIPAGSSLAIVGETGAGKSTLLSLLSGLYEPDEGSILIDGNPIQRIAWREVIGAVPQGPHLFEASVQDNIGLGMPDVTLDEVKHAAQLAGAEEFILKLPDGYGTLVRREGGTLSAGQAQRIAIARALVRNPQFLFLDEATSHLDAKTESAIWSSMGKEHRRTTVYVTHRLATSALADRIAVMHEGRIVEEGTWQELMDRNGLYKELWHRQNPMLDKEKEEEHVARGSF